MATGRIGVTPNLRTRWSKAPAGGTTSLSGLDDNSVSLVYDAGFEAVYRNGVLLSRGNDYTATNGTTITLIDATIAGDIIEVFANQAIPLTSTYTQAVADAKFINNSLVDAKGDIIAATAADTVARLAVGSNDQVLTADSSTATGLKWAAPAGMTLISTTTLSGATTTLSSIPGTYKHLLLLVVAATNATAAGYFTVDPNAAGNIGQSGRVEATNADAVVGDTDTGGKIKFNYGATLKRDGGENAAVLWIYNYASSTLSKPFDGSFQYQSASDTGIRSGTIMGRLATTSAITSLVLANSGGNFDGGTALLYGVS